jgi:hypothetical protein
MFYAPASGFTALHRAAQRGDEHEIAALLADVSCAPPPRQPRRPLRLMVVLRPPPAAPPACSRP